MTEETKKAPRLTLRAPGGLKATIWENPRKDGSSAFAVQFARTYRDANEGQLRDTNSFDAGEALQISVLATDAYKAMSELRAEKSADDAEPEQRL